MFADIVHLLSLTLTPEQTRACRYLERQGLVFCVDFGYGDAVERARAHWNQRRRERRRKAKP